MSRSERLSSLRLQRIQIRITRPDGGTLHGHLWWPAVFRNSTTRRGLRQNGTGTLSESSYPAGVGNAEEHNVTGNNVAGSNPVVVFVHQFSIMGGRSSLLFGMARLLAQAGIPAVTFDLRGVNLSSGWRTLTGHKETQDVVAACSWCVKQLQASNILIVGSSAGAPIGGSAVDQLPEIRGFVGIGYVFGTLASILFGGHYKNILKSRKPKLFIHGGDDGFTSTAAFKSYFETAQEPKEMQIIENVGHFEMEGPSFDSYMANQIVEFVDRYLPARDFRSEDIGTSAPTNENSDGKVGATPCSLRAD